MTAPRTVRELEIKNFIHEYTKVLTEYAKTEFGLPENWKPIIRITYAKGVKISRGGSYYGLPHFKIAAYRYTNLNTIDHIEYNHITKDPVIGAMGYVPWIKGLAALVAHEFAHAVDRTSKIAIPDTSKVMFHFGRKKVERVGHGMSWQHIYRKLRENFVNNFDLSTIPYKADPSITFKPIRTRKSTFTSSTICKRGIRHTCYYVNEKQIGTVSCVGRRYYVASKLENGNWTRLGTFETGVLARNTLLRGYC